MQKPLIFLADLTHITPSGRYVSEFIPYGIGCLKSFLHTHAACGNEYEIRLFKNPHEFIRAYLEETPEIVAFSNYAWNSDIAATFATEVKRRNPGVFVIMGGPDYPLEDPSRAKWLVKRPAVDVYIIGEAEVPLAAVIDCWHQHRDIRTVKEAMVEGCHSILDGTFLSRSDQIPRVMRLGTSPSPYVMGYLDEFLADETLIPMVETSRGCPFLCTFCEKGSKLWQKVSRIESIDDFEKELRYIAARTKHTVLVFAENNFGLLPEHTEIAKILLKLKAECNYPLSVMTATNKNWDAKTATVIEMLKGILPLTVSVQSMDAEVLTNIKRKNLPLAKLVEASTEAKKVGAASRSELILGLPGDSRKKHLDGLLTLIDHGIQHIISYTLILLEGTELNTDDSRARWKMQTRFRLNHRCYGRYDFGDHLLYSAEIEEVVIALDTLTFRDYLDIRAFFLTTSIFYTDDVLDELYRLLRNLAGIAPSSLLARLHEGREEFPEELRRIFQSFTDATTGELWDKRDEIEAWAKSDGLLKVLADDKLLGQNVIFTHRAMAMHHIPQIMEVAFAAAQSLISDDKQLFLLELKNFMVLRSADLFDPRASHQATFEYDFVRLVANDFKGDLETYRETVHIAFVHTEQQKGILGSFNASDETVARSFPKTLITRLQRTPIYA